MAVAGLALLAADCREPAEPLGGRTPRPAPSFELPSLEGETVRLWDQRGKTTVIGLWAVDCAECVQQAPELNRVLERHREADDVAVIGIEASGASAEAIRRWEGDHGAVARYPQLHGAEPKLARIFGAAMLPAIFVVTPEGSLDATLLGVHDAAMVEEAIDRVDRRSWERPLEAAPGFVLRDLDGDTLRLTDLRGRVVVIDFWATWCAECIDQPAELNRVWERHRDSGRVEVLGVELSGATPAKVRRWARRHGASARYPQLVGASEDLLRFFGGSGVPTTAVVAPDGSLDALMPGFHFADEIEAAIAHLLERPEAPDRLQLAPESGRL